MKQIIYACLFFLLSNYLIAQNKIDSLIQIDKSIDTTKAHLIYDYRLPDWGYSMFYINLSGNNSGHERSLNNKSIINNSMDISLAPMYYNFNESESKVTLFRFYFNTGYSFNKYKNELSIHNRKNRKNNFNTFISSDLTINKYFSSSLFYTTKTQQNFFYNESNFTEWPDGNKLKYASISRSYKTVNHIGIGYGRVRNVTPVLRALRFNERIKDLFKTNLNSKEIKKLADLFTRIDGYDNVYDRPNKYFYNDLPENIYDKLSELKPWEIFYLEDAIREIIGTRLEGYRIDVGTNINYDKENYSSYDRELFLAGFYINQDYYHNVCLNYQVGLNLYASYLKAINDNTPFKYVGNGIISFLNLWNLTDRLLVNWDFGFESGFLAADKNDRYNKWERMDDFFSDLFFNYYLENNMNIYLNARYGSITGWPSDISFNFANYYYHSYYDQEKLWSFSIGLRYYINRGIY